MNFIKLYYFTKPIIPKNLQIYLRSAITHWKKLRYEDVWPINENASSPPPNWKGWPNKKQFALILTHDVEFDRGQNKCIDLMLLEQRLGFRSSFNFVPERYSVSKPLLHELKKNDFEVGVHGLYHDGKLYQSRNIFQQRAKQINYYLNAWGAVGFRSPSMHHNLQWLLDLNIEYDASTFDTDPFEPQSDGVNTIFPFWVQEELANKGYIELPYTLVQDYTHFILFKKKNINIWKKKLDFIAEKGGMALLNTHPDYMNFTGRKFRADEYSVELYRDFLNYAKTKYENQYWQVLPKEMAHYWKNRELIKSQSRFKRAVAHAEQI